MAENGGTTGAVGDAAPVVDPQSPAPGAEDQKPNAAPASDADDQNPDPAETPEQQEAKRQSRRARSNARKAAELAEARTEARMLREQLAKQEAQPQQYQDAPAPKRDDFPDYEAYLEARADWRADQKVSAALKADREERQKTERRGEQSADSRKAAEAWSKRETAFQKATDDYEDAVGPFVEDDLQSFSGEARRAIIESEVGPQVLYHLSKHPDDAERIADLSPLRQVAELGKLETKLSAPVKKPSNAPAPPNPLNSGKTASSGITGNESQAEYEAKRKAQGARWAR